MGATRTFALLFCVLSRAVAVQQAAGSVNAFEGAVSLDGRPITAAGEQVRKGGVIKTGNGMAEILLAPGQFLRLGPGSEVTFGTIDPAQTLVAVDRGEALLESVNETAPVAVRQAGNVATVRSRGLFDFDRHHGRIADYSGKISVRRTARDVVIESGFEVSMHDLKPRSLRPRPADPLYAWSSYRSELLSSQSEAVAQTYPVTTDSVNAPSWVRTPWDGSYTFISPSGYVNSPFGWPFYAPGHTHNYIPFPPGGDSYLYGPPVIHLPPPAGAVTAPAVTTPPPSVPLTAPGVPAFPTSR